MFEYIKGKVSYITDSYIVVENNNIGFKLLSTSSVATKVSKNEEITVYTYMNVREDDISLYGFLSREEVNVFRLLIGISGIGPKGALSIMSVLSLEELRMAVVSEDYKAIAKANGVGTKTAQRVVIELKDKFKLEDVFPDFDDDNDVSSDTVGSSNDSISEVVMALTALGYSNIEALRAVKKVSGGNTMDVETLLKASLKNMM